MKVIACVTLYSPGASLTMWASTAVSFLSLCSVGRFLSSPLPEADEFVAGVGTELDLVETSHRSAETQKPLRATEGIDEDAREAPRKARDGVSIDRIMMASSR